jgi:hypothetical protein
MSLLDLQRQFMAFLHDPARGSHGELHAAVADGGRINVDRRLHIYHHAYRARLIELMEDLYERTWAYLGDGHFARCARSYVENHPASGRTLGGFGSAFPEWLASRFPDDGEIAEVAMIDWRLRTAFDGADAKPISLEDIAMISDEDWAVVGFAFHPTLAFVTLTYNAASIWEALEHEEVPPAAAKLDQPTPLLVWRKEWRPHFATIASTEATAIELLRRGESFAATCAMMDALYPNTNIAEAMGVSLRRWIDDGVLTAVRMPRA